MLYCTKPSTTLWRKITRLTLCLPLNIKGKCGSKHKRKLDCDQCSCSETCPTKRWVLEFSWKTNRKTSDVDIMSAVSDPRTNYDLTGLTKENREVDFYFISRSKTRYQCEVKLMGKEILRVLMGHTTLETVTFLWEISCQIWLKTQLDYNNIKWIELRRNEGFKNYLLS